MTLLGSSKFISLQRIPKRFFSSCTLRNVHMLSMGDQVIHLQPGPSTEEGHKGLERICSIVFVSDELTFALMVYVWLVITSPVHE